MVCGNVCCGNFIYITRVKNNRNATNYPKKNLRNSVNQHFNCLKGIKTPSRYFYQNKTKSN